MNSTLIAVFGHYDSRGGTTGMPLAGRNREAVEAAIAEYNKAFGWEEDIKSYLAWKERQAKGEPNPPCEFDWAWDPTQPYSSPGHSDFMFVAELWYEGELPDGDLEESGLVLINKFTEPSFDGADRGEFCGEQFELLIKLTLQRPTQLEFVPTEDGKYDERSRFEEADGIDESAWTKHVQGLSKKIREEEGRPFHYLGVEDRSWNDDAFGFIIGT